MIDKQKTTTKLKIKDRIKSEKCARVWAFDLLLTHEWLFYTFLWEKENTRDWIKQKNQMEVIFFEKSFFFDTQDTFEMHLKIHCLPWSQRSTRLATITHKTLFQSRVVQFFFVIYCKNCFFRRFFFYASAY